MCFRMALSPFKPRFKALQGSLKPTANIKIEKTNRKQSVQVFYKICESGNCLYTKLNDCGSLLEKNTLDFKMEKG